MQSQTPLLVTSYELAIGGLSTHLFGFECLRSRQVLSIIVAKVIVADDGHRLQTSRDQEVSDDRLDLCLARLEVVSTKKHVLLFG